MGNEEGIVKARDFKRLGDPAERWNMTKFNEIRGTPWKPNPETDDERIHIKVRLPHDDSPISPEFKGKQKNLKFEGIELVQQLSRNQVYG